MSLSLCTSGLERDTPCYCHRLAAGPGDGVGEIGELRQLRRLLQLALEDVRDLRLRNRDLSELLERGSAQTNDWATRLETMVDAGSQTGMHLSSVTQVPSPSWSRFGSPPRSPGAAPVLCRRVGDGPASPHKPSPRREVRSGRGMVAAALDQPTYRADAAAVEYLRRCAPDPEPQVSGLGETSDVADVVQGGLAWSLERARADARRSASPSGLLQGASTTASLSSLGVDKVQRARERIFDKGQSPAMPPKLGLASPPRSPVHAHASAYPQRAHGTPPRGVARSPPRGVAHSPPRSPPKSPPKSPPRSPPREARRFFSSPAGEPRAARQASPSRSSPGSRSSHERESETRDVSTAVWESMQRMRAKYAIKRSPASQAFLAGVLRRDRGELAPVPAPPEAARDTSDMARESRRALDQLRGGERPDLSSVDTDIRSLRQGLGLPPRPR